MTQSIPPFSFYLPTNIGFGPGEAMKLAEHCRADGYSSAFVVIDPGVHRAGMLTPHLDSLAEGGIASTLWTDLQTNPVDQDVERAAEAMRVADADVIIGIGGGSALDTAKGVAILRTNGGQIRDYAGQGRVPSRAWPLYLVPTTAGTGSEVTANASITQHVTLDKLAIRDPNAYAHRAILDPGLLAGLPAAPAAAAAIDALTHAIESYTSVRANVMTRLLALDAVSRIARSIEAFIHDRGNQQAAAEMLYASCLAGIVISHTGTGSAHSVSRALGGRFGVSHGVGCGVALAPVMRFNAEADPDLYLPVATALGVGHDGQDAKAISMRAADAVDRIRAEIGLPDRLDLECDEPLLAELASWVAQNAGPNPRPTSHAEATALLTQVI